MPLWLAALITTVVYGVVAAVLALRGRDELKQAGTPIPGQTRDSIKEDIQWAKTRAQSKGQIEETREHMGDTVSALAYKADVPARMRDSAAEKKDAVTSKLAGAKNAITGTTGDAVDSAGDKPSGRLGWHRRIRSAWRSAPSAVGFVVGSLLPKTRVEQEKTGADGNRGPRTGQRTRLRGGRARQASGRGHHARSRRNGDPIGQGTRRRAARLSQGRDDRPLRCPAWRPTGKDTVRAGWAPCSVVETVRWRRRSGDAEPIAVVGKVGCG